MIESPLALKPFLRLPSAQLTSTLVIPSCQSENSIRHRLIACLYTLISAGWQDGPVALSPIDCFY
jgi:hypothetical protein